MSEFKIGDKVCFIEEELRFIDPNQNIELIVEGIHEDLLYFKGDESAGWHKSRFKLAKLGNKVGKTISLKNLVEKVRDETGLEIFNFSVQIGCHGNSLEFSKDEVSLYEIPVIIGNLISLLKG